MTDYGVISLILSFLNLRKLCIQRKYARTSVEDGKIKVTLTLVNGSRFPKYMLLVQDRFPSLDPNRKNEKILVPYMPPKGRINVSYEVRCYERGAFKFGKIRIESRGFLGFFYMTKNFSASPDKIIIFPKSYRLDHFILDNVSPFYATQEKTYKFTGRSHDFLGIREYTPGEETRYIHWPSTAKQGKLMVKEFKEIATHSLTVVLDTHEFSTYGTGKETTSEDIYRTAATLLKASKRRRYTFDLFARKNDHLLEDRNLSSQKGMYRLAELQSNSPGPLERDLPEIIRKVRALDHIYILKTLPFTDLAPLKEFLDKRVFTTVIFYDPNSYLDKAREKPKEERRGLFSLFAGKKKASEPEISDKYLELQNIDYENQIRQLRKMGINVYIYNKGASLNSIFSFRRPINASPIH